MAALGLILVRYWKPLALGAVLAAVFGYGALLTHQRNAARAVAVRLTADAATLRSANQALTAAAGQQNAAVEALRHQADSASAAMAAHAGAAAQAGANAAGSAAAVAHTLAVAPIDSGCDAAIRWGNARAAELSRW